MKTNTKLAIVASSFLLSGIGFGYLLSKAIDAKKTNFCGNLRIDKSDADEDPKLFLEITDLHKLYSSNIAVLKIIKKNYVSQ